MTNFALMQELIDGTGVFAEREGVGPFRLLQADVHGQIASRGVLNFRISPDGSRVVYQTLRPTDFVFELFSAPITGGGEATLNGPLVFGGSVANFQLSPDGSRVVYKADEEIDDQFGLYATTLGTELVVDLPANSDGNDIVVRRNGTFVEVFDAQAEEVLVQGHLDLTTSIVINGTNFDDRLTVDHSFGGLISLPGRVMFHAGRGIDTAVVRGPGGGTALLEPVDGRLSAGIITVSQFGLDSTLYFRGVEPVEVSGVDGLAVSGPLDIAAAELTLDLPGFPT